MPEQNILSDRGHLLNHPERIEGHLDDLTVYGNVTSSDQLLEPITEFTSKEARVQRRVQLTIEVVRRHLGKKIELYRWKWGTWVLHAQGTISDTQHAFDGLPVGIYYRVVISHQ